MPSNGVTPLECEVRFPAEFRVNDFKAIVCTLLREQNSCNNKVQEIIALWDNRRSRNYIMDKEGV